MEDTIEVCSGCGKMPRPIDFLNEQFLCSRCGNSHTLLVTSDQYESIATRLDQKFHSNIIEARIDIGKKHHHSSMNSHHKSSSKKARKSAKKPAKKAAKKKAAKKKAKKPAKKAKKQVRKSSKPKKKPAKKAKKKRR